MLSKLQNISEKAAGRAATVAGAAFAAEGIVQIIHPQHSGSKVVGTAGHLVISFFIVGLIAMALCVPLMHRVSEILGGLVIAGTVRGVTPFRGQLPRGDRDVKLVIRAPGYVERTVVVRPTQPIHQRVALTRKAPPPAPPKRSKLDRDRSVNPFD